MEIQYCKLLENSREELGNRETWISRFILNDGRNLNEQQRARNDGRGINCGSANDV